MVRKTVTLVFCDVADSTPLGERLDPEALRDVWSRYHETARAVLERHGGTIEKFIGDAVMAAFGIPVAHEDDALRAVRAAVELRDELEALNDELERGYGVRIGVRTGVNTGEVIAGDPAQGQAFATGDAVNVAQRLEASAEAGEILLGDVTMQLVREVVSAERLPELELKGKAAPVAAWRVLSVEPRPPGTVRRHDTPLVGRRSELDRLHAELEHAVAERSCRVLSIVGEPGVGKSRLAAELVGSFGAEVLGLEGRCLPYGRGITFWPLVEIVRGLDLESILAEEPDGDVIAARVLEVTGRTEPCSRTDELYWAVRRLFETLARDRPTVVVLDDVQWAEPALLDLVEYLAGWSRDAPVLICCLARTEFAEMRPAWSRLSLQPLSPDETSTLLHSLVGPLEPHASGRLGRVTGGNPLFVEEMVQMLADEERLVKGDGVAELDLVRVPATIQAVLAARLDRLAPAERDVLQRASVIGEVFWWGPVAELSSAAGVGAVAADLQALVRKGLLKPDGRSLAGEDGFSFAHILVRDAAYESTPKRVRAELHERFADWLAGRLASRPELDEILGHHLEQARAYRLELGHAGDEESTLALRAAEALARAGRRAQGRGDVHAAADLLERAVALLPATDPERLALLPELGLALTETGELARAEAVLDEAVAVAAERGDERLELNARIERAALKLISDPRGGYEGELSLIEDAIPRLAALGDHRGQARAWFLIGRGRGLWAGRHGVGEKALERALAHVQLAGDRRQHADIVSQLGFAAWSGPTPVPDAIRRCEEILETANDDRLIQATARRWLGSLVAREGRFAEGRSLLAQAVSAYEELGMRLNAVGVGAFGYGDVAFLAGEYEAAAEALRRGYDVLREMGERGYSSSVAGFLARALYELGRYDEAERYTRTSEATASEDDTWSQVLFRATRAKLLAGQGQHDEAAELGDAAVAIAERTDLLDLRGDVLLDLAEVLRSAGAQDEANASVRRALALYELKGNLVSAERARTLLAEAPART